MINATLKITGCKNYEKYKHFKTKLHNNGFPELDKRPNLLLFIYKGTLIN